MRVDAYTKAVLTIIAACLLWMCVAGTVLTPVAAQAQREPQEVIIVGSRTPQDVTLVGSRTPIPVMTPPKTSLMVRPGAEWYQEPILVDAPRPLLTKLAGVERPAVGRWDPLDVNVKEQPRKTTPGHRP
jgi:hypothetical protein